MVSAVPVTSFPAAHLEVWHQSAARASTAATIRVGDERFLPAGFPGERTLTLDRATRRRREEFTNINTPVTLCRRLAVFSENASLAERLAVIVSLNRRLRGLWPLPRQVRQPGPPRLRDLSYEWAGLKIV